MLEQNTAKSYIQTWQDNALTSSGVNYFYGDTATSGLVYNIFADVMLNLEFVPANVYTVLTTAYNSMIS